MMKKLIGGPMLGILGAGRAGTAMARLALKAGYCVLNSNSRGPESLLLMVEVLMPGAVAATSDEVADRLSGKIVIDAMNYWAIGGGMLAEFEASPGRSSETVQAFLAGSRVVKTLNHMGYLELEEQGLPAGTPGRRAFAFAGDDPEAKMIVAGLISDLGFDSFDAGLLSEGWRFAPGSPIFGGSFNLEELRSAP